MKKLLLLTTILLGLVTFGLLVYSNTFKALAVVDCDPTHKVYICHANEGIKNYTMNCVDKNSTTDGHGDHEGDIIPSYTYQVWEKTGTTMVCPNNYSLSLVTCPGKCFKNSHPLDASRCVDEVSEDVYGWVTYTFSAQGDQSILANNCVISTPTPTPTATPSSDPTSTPTPTPTATPTDEEPTPTATSESGTGGSSTSSSSSSSSNDASSTPQVLGVSTLAKQVDLKKQ